MANERHIEQLPSGTFRVRLIYNGQAHYSSTVNTLEEAVDLRMKLYKQLGLAFTNDDGSVPQVLIQASESEDELLEFEEQALARAIEVSKNTLSRAARARKNVIPFDHGPLVIVFMGDVHLGNPGTDHERVFNDAHVIAATPGMYVWLMGDTLDSFVKTSIMSARFNAPVTIREEWALVKRLLRVMGPKILGASGSGPHHDGWVTKLTGIDYFEDVLGQIAPQAIYNANEVQVLFKIGDYEVPALLRHKWKGSSIYNATHGIERAARERQNFTLGVGAHIHGRGLARDFAVGGIDGLAVQVGSYKREDDYAYEIGAANSNDAAAMAVLFDDASETMVGFRSLELAAFFLETLYKGAK